MGANMGLSSIENVGDEIASHANRAVGSMVSLHARGRRIGTGTIWHADGFIITNAHVADFDSALGVTLQDGREASARVIGMDREQDVAVLSIDADNLPTVEIGDSRQLHPGEFVFSMGFPWGVPDGLTAGVVITVGKWIENGNRSTRDWLIASLKLRPGHSGGPMLDSHGRLVGINTMMHGPDVGAAVPSHVVKASLKKIVE
jgi:S1-C subfamily serine protease